MQINNPFRLEKEPFPLDINHLDGFSPNEFFGDLEMEHGSGSLRDDDGGDDDEWKTFVNWEELNDPEDGKGNDLLLPKS